MKGTLKWFLLLAAVLLAISSCDLIGPDPQVRFKNSTTDLQISYGIRLGTATYVGVFGPNASTSYDSTAPGTYYVELLDGAGNWSDDSTLPFKVQRWNMYTLEITGSFAAYYYSLNED